MSSLRKHLKAASLLLFMISVCRVTSLCRPSEYQVNNECCPKCQPGTYVRRDCTEFTSTSCSFCADGTFSSVPSGLKRCWLCTSCTPDSGLKTNISCTKTQDATCQPLEGFHCIEPRGAHCEAAEKHSQCKPGQYIRYNGTAFKDTECADCSTGTFSDGTFTACQPHTLCDSENPFLLTEGTASTDAVCGKHDSTTITTVIVIVVIFLFGASAVVFWMMKKKLKGKMGNAEESTKKEHRTREGINLMETA